MIVGEAIKGYFDQFKAYIALAVVLGVLALGAYAYMLRADNIALRAQVTPLKQAAKDAAKLSDGYRTALQNCENSKLAMKQANDRALSDAQAAQAAADTKAEDYLRQLQHPGTDCAAITQVKVCPRLMGY